MPEPTVEGILRWNKLSKVDKDAIEEFHKKTLCRERLTINDFTCANCAVVAHCSVAYDLYNLDDECKMEE